MAIEHAEWSQRFPSTHWPSLLLAGQHPQTSGREAFDQLLQTYRAPLLAHLQWCFHVPREQAEDWLHGFIEKKILEKQLLESASQERGRFRTFLLNALDNFVHDELHRQNRIKRKPEGGWISLDQVPGLEKTGMIELHVDPFDILWAKTVVQQAVQHMQEYYRAKRRPDLWGLFYDGFVRPTLEESQPPSMADLARRFGFTTPVQASNGLITAKRMFKRRLESVVAEYAQDKDNLDQEIAELITTLASQEKNNE